MRTKLWTRNHIAGSTTYLRNICNYSYKSKPKFTSHRQGLHLPFEELIVLYWTIGKAILENQSSNGWGAKTIDQLAKDFMVAFPGVSGFSSRNLKYMRKFAKEYPELAFAQAVLARWSGRTLERSLKSNLHLKTREGNHKL